MIRQWTLILTMCAIAPLNDVETATTLSLRMRESFQSGRRVRSGVPLTLLLPTAYLPCRQVEVVRLWHDGKGWPTWHTDDVGIAAMSGDTLTIYGKPGREVILQVSCPGRGGYLVHGPLRWPLKPESQLLDARLRRTVRVQLPTSTRYFQRLIWLGNSTVFGGDRWPICLQTDDWSCECTGVPFDEGGLVLIPDSDPFMYGVAPGGQESGTIESISLTAAAWGRLVRLWSTAVSLSAMETVQVSVKMASRVGNRPKSLRVLLEPDATTAALRVGGELYWVSGGREVEGRVLEIRGAEVATVRLPIRDWQFGPPEIPVYVTVGASSAVKGQVVSATGQPAPGALVTVWEELDEPHKSSIEGRRQPQRCVLAEARTDLNGDFQLDGLGQGSYEFVAIHPSLGRSSATRSPDGRPILLRLMSPKLIRGRVVRRGQPVEAVLVLTVPDLVEFAASVDPLEHVGMEAYTDSDGRFMLGLPPRGSAELRIGSGETGVVRIPLPASDDLPRLTDVGDVELRRPIRLVATLDNRDACELYAVGPLGLAGLEVVTSTQVAPGNRVVSLPEAGRWMLTLTCGGREEPIVPPFVDLLPDDVEVYLHLVPQGVPSRQ